MAASAPAPNSTRAAPEPPPLHALTVNQIEAVHPGVAGRLRGWIKRCDAGDPAFIALRFAVVRVGRSVLVDEIRFRKWLHERSAVPPSESRNPEGLNGQRNKRHAAAAPAPAPAARRRSHAFKAIAARRGRETV
jgi:hypothetical protein